jgi:hypothetical protein
MVVFVDINFKIWFSSEILLNSRVRHQMWNMNVRLIFFIKETIILYKFRREQTLKIEKNTN